MQNICSNCGNILTEKDNFCSKCGEVQKEKRKKTSGKIRSSLILCIIFLLITLSMIPFIIDEINVPYSTSKPIEIAYVLIPFSFIPFLFVVIRAHLGISETNKNMFITGKNIGIFTLIIGYIVLISNFILLFILALM